MKKLLCVYMFYRHRGSHEGNAKEFAVRTDTKLNLIYAPRYINLASCAPSLNLKAKSGKKHCVRNFVTVLIYIGIVMSRKKKKHGGDAKVNNSFTHILKRRPHDHIRDVHTHTHTRLSSEAKRPFIKDKRAPKCQRLMDTASSSLPPVVIILRN